ncbi:MAG: sulfite exporter TauE/SafE family protein [Litoreibacter sp.]
MNQISTLTDLTLTQLMALSAIVFVAGMVRGFSGFGLSAVAMAVAVLILPPVQLIPVFWFLEMAGSFAMFKGGMTEADLPTAKGLIIGSGLGLPVGLSLTIALAPETSKTLALSGLLVLAGLQLAKVRLPFLASRAGTLAAGFGGGFSTGIAGAGGMFIALYTLARELPPRTMRGTLSIYLFGAGALGLITHLIAATMDQTAIARGVTLIAPALAGLYVGRLFFIERLTPYYKPACLTLLMSLAMLGLARIIST